MLSMISRGAIQDPAVVKEFEHLISRLRGFLSQSFDEDGELVVADPNLAIMPVGGVTDFAGSVAPTGWLLCDGTQVSRVAYKSLFDAIGTNYGAGDGSTTFNIPDARQRFSLGKAAAGTGSTLGATGGAIDHTHSGGSHTHSTPAHAHSVTGSTSANGGHSHTVNAHQHSIGNHSHTVTGQATETDDLTNGSVGVTSGGATGASIWGHNHLVDLTTSSAGSSLTGTNSPGTDTVADHTHSTSGTTDTSGSGTTGSASGTTGAENPAFVVFNKIIFAGV